MAVHIQHTASKMAPRHSAEWHSSKLKNVMFSTKGKKSLKTNLAKCKLGYHFLRKAKFLHELFIILLVQSFKFKYQNSTEKV